MNNEIIHMYIVLKQTSAIKIFVFLSMFFFEGISCKNTVKSKRVVLPNTQNEKNQLFDKEPKRDNKILIGTSLDSIEKENLQIIEMSNNSTKKLIISNFDSSISLIADVKFYHRIFGYDAPNLKSKRKILISIFTNEVENNPYGCEYGSYYQTADVLEYSMKFISKEKEFMKVKISRANSSDDFVYFPKACVEFVD
jgi:hypothetical protein